MVHHGQVHDKEEGSDERTLDDIEEIHNPGVTPHPTVEVIKKETGELAGEQRKDCEGDLCHGSACNYALVT